MSVLPFDQRDGSIWMNGALVAWKDAKLHVLSHGLHYGSCVFEGERAYGGVIFKSREHSERFRRSAELLDFEIPYSVEELIAAKDLVVAKNGLTNCYVRPCRLARVGNDGGLRPERHDPRRHRGLGLAVDVRHRDQDEGHQARHRRISPPRSGLTRRAHSKAAGLYMICTISKHRAERRGYADAMMLDWQGRVAECTGANIFFTRDGEIHTPIADCFLDGITRQTVIALAKAQGDQGDRAPDHARGAGGFRRMLHLRHRRRSDAGLGHRPL